MTLREYTLRRVLHVLKESGWNRTQAAQALGVSIRTIRNMLHECKRMGLVTLIPDLRRPNADYAPQEPWGQFRPKLLEALKKNQWRRGVTSRALKITPAIMTRMIKRLAAEGEHCPPAKLKLPPRKPRCLRCKELITVKPGRPKNHCEPCIALNALDKAYQREQKMQSNGLQPGQVTRDEAERIRSRLRIKQGR